MKLLTILLAVLLAICAGGWFLSARSNASQARELQELADSAQKQALSLAGYASAYARVGEWAQTLDSTSTALRNELERLQAQRIARAEIVTETVVDTVLVGEPLPVNGFYANVDFDPISGTVSFTPPRNFGLNLKVNVRLEQYIVQSASDQLLIGVRPLSPRTTVEVETFDATPYLRHEKKTSWWKYAAAFVGGVVTWELVR